MSLTRRGFLKAFGAAIAALALPRIAAPVWSPATVLPVVEPAAAVPASNVTAGLIRNISAACRLDYIDVTSLNDDCRETLASRYFEIDVEMYFDPASCPRVGDELDAQWFEAHGMRKLFNFNADIIEIWPRGLKFLVTERSIAMPAGDPPVATLRLRAV